MRRTAVLVLLLLSIGCARPRVVLPSDSGVELGDFKAIHATLTAACSGVRTLTGELSLAGHAGRQKMRGRVIMGFARPSSMRLEGVAPFGPPVFVLAAHDAESVLVLPRDDRVVRGESAADVLAALTGLALTPSELQAVITGCVESNSEATGGRLHANGWATIELAGGARLYLDKLRDRWRLRSAARAGWQIDYDVWGGAFPGRIALRSVPDASVDLSVTLAQLETNVDIDDAAFRVVVPPTAEPLTIEQLRAAGPLGER